MQTVTGRTGPHPPLTPRVALGTSSLRPSGLGWSSMGHNVLVLLSWSWDTHCYLHRGLHSRGHHHPASQAVLKAGFLIPTVSPSHLLIITALSCPHLFMDHRRGLLKDWQCSSCREGSFPRREGPVNRKPRVAFCCYLQLEPLSIPKAPCFGGSGCIRETWR